MPRVRFQPLVISKRRWRGPWLPSYDNSERNDYEPVDYDVEKHEESEWEDASHASSSANSSRVSSASYDSQDTLVESRKRKRKPASAYAPRKQCNLYFTVILGTVLVVFVLTLFSLHKRSAAEVSSGIHKSEAKPPPWHDFPKLERYWGGLQSLVAQDDWKPEYPGTVEEIREEIVEALEEAAGSDEVKRRGIDSVKAVGAKPWKTRIDSAAGPCYLDQAKKIPVPQIHGYAGIPQGFPDHVVGVHALRNESVMTCVDRYQRLGSYGFGYNQQEGGTGAGLDADRSGSHSMEIDYRNVQWAQAQEACAMSSTAQSTAHKTPSPDHRESDSAQTAILIRTGLDHAFNVEEIMQLRALIAEAALATGGLFTVFFLIQVTDASFDIWSNSKVYREVANRALPKEFADMGILWSESQMHSAYVDLAEPGDSVYTAGRGTYLPVQQFALQHEEFEHFWVWDLNARYTGHIGELLASANHWSTIQPRKELWERSARFYVPSEHGTWDDFLHMVHVLAEHGPPDPFRDPTDDHSTSGPRPIWGPQTIDSVEHSLLVQPPSAASSDSYSWGISEAADFISLSPVFDPNHVSGFAPSSDVRGYTTTDSLPPRRATTSSIVRLSRRLLNVMHAETSERGRYMAPEMWPASVALHYGLKAVFAPHAMYIDRTWPTDYLAAVLNTGSDGGVVSGRSSVFGEAHRNVFDGLSWGADPGQSGFGRSLWRRWLGYRDEMTGEGGEEWEEAGEGRMCLPPMLLDNVGSVNLIVEEVEDPIT